MQLGVQNTNVQIGQKFLEKYERIKKATSYVALNANTTEKGIDLTI